MRVRCAENCGGSPLFAVCVLSPVYARLFKRDNVAADLPAGPNWIANRYRRIRGCEGGYNNRRVTSMLV
ncbi:MAG: hypothetical protein JOZ22_13915 [Acidobacteriia bacterium]|nr:hypothetical protein [Terriglobia bacterium]